MTSHVIHEGGPNAEETAEVEKARHEERNGRKDKPGQP